jgi:type II secretory pathway pseudopilin PulG
MNAELNRLCAKLPSMSANSRAKDSGSRGSGSIHHSPRRRRGITLLELAIVLSIAGVAFWIVLPTLRPTGDEANIEFAKESLAYLHTQQQLYFNLHGQYAPMSKLATDPALGKRFDKRFAKDDVEVRGVKFSGPKAVGITYEIVASLPAEAGRYKVDQTGNIVALP